MLTAALKLRIAVVLGLFAAPVAFLAAVGSYHLWTTGWSFAAWGGMAACFLASYALAWYWTRRGKGAAALPRTGPGAAPEYWTDRDREAWKLVEAHAAAQEALTADQMGDYDRWAADARDLALKVAGVYVPGTTDPFGHLTVPEVLACGQLVTEDLTELVNKYVPGSHLLSIRDWTQARSAVDSASTWYPRVRNAYWALSAFIDPVKAGLQVLGTKAGLAPVFERVQQNMLLWFHTAYVHKLGRYLIELNSGRLKVGAVRYRSLLAEHAAPEGEKRRGGEEERGREEEKPNGQPSSNPLLHHSPSPPLPPPVTLAVVGPVKAGKSSLVNALLGEQRAATGVTPLTARATKYTLDQPDLPRFTLVDTAGYGNQGATDADLAAALDAAKDADILLLAAPARSAARAPEVDFFTRLTAAFAAAPHLKMPPTVLVLTHADLLTPAAEWSPPYDWREGVRPKERTMREAVAAGREQFGAGVVDAVPVCAAPGREAFGIRDDLLAVVAAQLGEARGVGLLRALHAEAAADKWKRTRGQLLNAGKVALGAFLQGMKK